MKLVYQFLANSMLVVFSLALNHPKKRQICFGLLFLTNFLFDNYPCNNSIVIILLFFSNFTEVYPPVTFELVSFLTVASNLILYGHGYSFLKRITGSSNYLYFENFAFGSTITAFLCLTVGSLKKFTK